MLLFRPPTPETIRNFLHAQAAADFTYAAVGATAGTPPAGFVVDRTRVLLGTGAEVFCAARAALECWEQFRLGWVQPWPGDTPLERGQAVAIVARSFGSWWLNACRIVYTVAEEGRFGFAYGTLPGHAECGEERFLIEVDPADGSVWYDILAFSRPRHPLARLGKPLVRRLQKRFGRDSAAALRRAVGPQGV